MSYNAFMKMSIFLIAPLVLLALGNPVSAGEQGDPLIETRKVSGAGEFAAQVEALVAKYPKAAFIFDSDGCLTNCSQPVGLSAKPRGDMVDYFKFLHRREFFVVVSTAWNIPIEAIKRLKSMDLSEVLRLNGEIESGERQFGQSTCKFWRIGSVASIQRTSLKANTKNDPYYYRQKAFALEAVLGEVCAFDLVIFCEDSLYNCKVFLNDLEEAAFRPSLKKLVIFELPEINGESRAEDTIDLKHLPAAFRTPPKEISIKRSSSGEYDSFSYDDDSGSDTQDLSSLKGNKGDGSEVLSKSTGSCRDEASTSQSKSGREKLIHSQ